MNERLVEILIFLMQEIQHNRKGMDQLDGLSKELREQGYTENEINAAFSWLFERIEAQKDDVFLKDQGAGEGSFRVLHEVEKMVLSPKAYGYILQLRELGLITQAEMEQIIERAMMLGVPQIDIEDVKSIVASIFFNGEDSDFQQLGKSILDTDGIVH